MFCRMHALKLTIFHATNSDLKKYSKQVKTQLKSLIASVKSVEIDIIVEETDLLCWL